MKSIATLLVVACLTIVPSPIGARLLRAQETTTHVRFGATTLKLDTGFRAALTARGIEVSTVAPAVFVPGKEVFRFPICGGAIDFTDVRGEITHTGGLRFVHNSDVLSVTDFLLGIPAQDAFTRRCPLSALFIANHSLVPRDKLFDLDFTNSDPVLSFPKSDIQRVLLTDVIARLTEFGAARFNQVFGTTFATDTPVGVFTIRTIASEEL